MGNRNKQIKNLYNFITASICELFDNTANKLQKARFLSNKPCKICGNNWTTQRVDISKDNGYGVMWCCDPWCDHTFIRWPMTSEEYSKYKKNKLDKLNKKS